MPGVETLAKWGVVLVLAAGSIYGLVRVIGNSRVWKERWKHDKAHGEESARAARVIGKVRGNLSRILRRNRDE